MRRYRGSYLLLLLACVSVAAVSAGCGGGGNSGGAAKVGPVATVTISPAPASMDIGGVIGFVAAPKDSNGKTVFSATVTWTSSNTAIDIANNGLACGGKWDSLTAPIVCTPAAGPQVTTITATADGKTASTTLYVHRHIDNIVVTPSIAFPTCLSQGQTQQYTATAFSGGVALPLSEIGSFTFVVAESTIATNLAADQPAGQPADQTTVKAKNPGMTTVIAFASGTSSVAANFTTCGVNRITLHVASSTDTAFSIATSATKQLTADVVDVNGNTITGLNLTYSTSSRAATISAAGLVTGVAPGQATFTASCSPNACGQGVGIPVYSNPVVGTITSTSALSTTVFVTSSKFTTESPVILPISTSNNSVGTAIQLSDVNGVKTVPNSILANPASTRVFVGTSNGLLALDAAANTVLGLVSNVPGRVISISPNSRKLVISDATNNFTYVFDNDTSTFDTLTGAATAATWTPDSLKAYIVTGTTLYQYSVTAISLRTIPIGDTGQSAAMLPGGAFAYFGTNGGSLDARATCRNDSTYVPESSVATDTGVQFAAGVALNSGTAPTVKVLDVGGTQMTVDTPAVTPAGAGTMCPPGIASAQSSADWTGFGIASFTPRQLIVLENGSKAYVTSNQSVLLGYDVAANTAFTIAVGATDTWTGGALSDSSQLYVGGSDGAVHVIDTATGLQTATIPITFNGSTTCAGTVCTPDLVAVRP